MLIFWKTDLELSVFLTESFKNDWMTLFHTQSQLSVSSSSSSSCFFSFAFQGSGIIWFRHTVYMQRRGWQPSWMYWVLTGCEFLLALPSKVFSLSVRPGTIRPPFFLYSKRDLIPNLIFSFLTQNAFYRGGLYRHLPALRKSVVETIGTYLCTSSMLRSGRSVHPWRQGCPRDIRNHITSLHVITWPRGP